MDMQTCSVCGTSFDFDTSGFRGPSKKLVCTKVCAQKSAGAHGNKAVVHSTETTSSVTRNDGIAMIIFLQSLAGIDESKAQAGKGWDALSAHDRNQTQSAYKAMGGPDL